MAARGTMHKAKRKNSDVEDATVTSKKLKSADQEASEYQDQLSRLSTIDPDFYQFLLEEDCELLQFQEEGLGNSQSDENEELQSNQSGREEDLGNSLSDYENGLENNQSDGKEGLESNQSDDSEELKGSNSDEELKTIQSDGDIEGRITREVVTKVTVKKWRMVAKEQADSGKVLTDHVISTLANMTQALHCGISHNLASHNLQESLVYRLQDGHVFNLLLSGCLQWMPTILKPLRLRGKVKKIAVEFSSDLLTLLNTMTDSGMLCMVLSVIKKLIKCFLISPKMTKQLTRVLVKLWSGTDSLVTMGAHICLQELVTLNSVATETILKQLYVAMVALARYSSPEGVFLHQSSLVQLLRRDCSLAYQFAYSRIRLLAASLRAVVVSGENQQKVLSWQFLRCAQLWAQLLSKEPLLWQLMYPLVQICLGCIMLQQKPNYFPLRLHFTRLLLSLATTQHCFIPVAPLLLEISAYHFTFSASVKARPVSMATTIRLSKQSLQSKTAQVAILEECFEQLLDYFCLYSHSICFPELVFPTIQQLRVVAKETKVPWLRRQLRQVIAKVEDVSEAIQSNRSKVSEFGPSDHKKVQQWEAEQSSNNSLTQFALTWKQFKQQEIDDSSSVVMGQ